MLTLEPRASGFGCRVATIGPMVVAVFDDSNPELAMLDLLEQVQKEHIAKYGLICGINLITMPKLAPPIAEFRTRSAELAKKHQAFLRGAAIVVLTTGAVAVITRGFLAAYFLLVQQSSPQATFRDIASAVKWLKELPGQDPELRDMPGMIEQIEAFTYPKPTGG